PQHPLAARSAPAAAATPCPAQCREALGEATSVGAMVPPCPAPVPPAWRSPQLVAVGHHAWAADHIEEPRALHEVLVLLVLEQDQRAVLPGRNVAGDLPTIAEQLLDREGGLLCRHRRGSKQLQDKGAGDGSHARPHWVHGTISALCDQHSADGAGRLWHAARVRKNSGRGHLDAPAAVNAARHMRPMRPAQYWRAGHPSPLPRTGATAAGGPP